MTGGTSWTTTRWNGDKGRPSWDGRTTSSARPMKGLWTMQSYIRSWEAAKSPMSIRSNGWNTHLTTYTRASQRTNSQSYCLTTLLETRCFSDGYVFSNQGTGMPWSDMLTCPSKISSILYPYSKFEFRNITQSHKHNYKNPIRNPQVFL